MLHLDSHEWVWWWLVFNSHLISSQKRQNSSHKNITKNVYVLTSAALCVGKGADDEDVVEAVVGVINEREVRGGRRWSLGTKLIWSTINSVVLLKVVTPKPPWSQTSAFSCLHHHELTSSKPRNLSGIKRNFYPVACILKVLFWKCSCLLAFTLRIFRNMSKHWTYAIITSTLHDPLLSSRCGV